MMECTGEVMKKTKSKMIEAKDKLLDKATIVKDKIVDKTNMAKDKFEDVAKKTGKYIDKNPRKAAAMAVGIGAVVGAAIIAGTRKKKRRFF